PLPSPPTAALENPAALKILHENPDLFEVVTPINVDRFEKLLETHPNRPFVESVIRGFREGFWPFAENDLDLYPETCDHPERNLRFADADDLAWAQEQCVEEERLARFSKPFGSPGDPLLPGMTNVPVHVVPKPHSTKRRLIVDHSAGEFSPNSIISRDRVHVHLDTVQHLGRNL
ncbi:hypothetical protein BV25DRAFT_1768143, partial [Artomyces pyxidatus]